MSRVGGRQVAQQQWWQQPAQAVAHVAAHTGAVTQHASSRQHPQQDAVGLELKQRPANAKGYARTHRKRGTRG